MALQGCYADAMPNPDAHHILTSPPLTYVSRFLPSDVATDTLEGLLRDLDWQRPAIRLYGKTHLIPRQQVWMGDHAYRFSGNDFLPCPWHPLVADLRDRLNAQLPPTTPLFNSVLINRYRSGDDRMGWHCDNERELGPLPVIASISLGASRPMRFRWKDRRSPAFNVWLDHGSLLWMGPGCQEQLEHALLPRSSVGQRVNLTFRHLDTAS